jgi:SNF2 family DNA or RNA helicase
LIRGASHTGALIFANVHADGQQLIIMSEGSEPEMIFAARQLGMTTPHYTPVLDENGNPHPVGALLCPLTWPAVLQLANSYPGRWRPYPKLLAWMQAEVTRRTAELTGALAGYTGTRTPYAHQIADALAIAREGRALLDHDPGTGKSMSAVLGLLERAAAGHQVLPILVIAPLSVVGAWLDEFAALAPHWRAVAWHGTNRHRHTGRADVYVTTYGTLVRDAATEHKARAERAKGYNRSLIRLAPASVVCDEVHLTKNHAAEQSKAAVRLGLRAAQFIALSGTPITHHAGDRWPALNMLEPGAWSSRSDYIARYCFVSQDPGQYRETIHGLNPGTEAEFHDTLLGRRHRVAKADVLELPPKVYSVRKVEIPPVWRKVYDQMTAEMLADLPDGDELSVMDTIVQLNRLCVLSSCAGEIELVPKVDADGNPVYSPLTGEQEMRQRLHPRMPSWKVDALLEIKAERPGQQLLCFSESRGLAELAGAAAAKAGHRVGYVVGGQGKRERDGQIAAFQAGELDLMVLTLKAGGVGITLTAASTVVFLQRPFSIVESIQAEDRAHRIGSERHESIEIIDVMVPGTVEAKIRTVLRTKAGALSDVLGDPRIVAELLGGSRGSG